MEISTKYDIGDKCWCMEDNMPVEILIEKIEVYATLLPTSRLYTIKYVGIKCGANCGYSIEVYDKEVFDTKDELINSLIKNF